MLVSESIRSGMVSDLTDKPEDYSDPKYRMFSEKNKRKLRKMGSEGKEVADLVVEIRNKLLKQRGRK